MIKGTMARDLLLFGTRPRPEGPENVGGFGRRWDCHPIYVHFFRDFSFTLAGLNSVGVKVENTLTTHDSLRDAHKQGA